jgi:hypothetical protein
MWDREEGEEREHQTESGNALETYRPPCLTYKGQDDSCSACLIQTTGRCEQFLKKLSWFQNRYRDLHPADKSAIFNEMFKRVVTRISRETDRPISSFSGLLEKVYKGTVADFFTQRGRRGLTGFGDKKPGDCGVSLVSPDLSENEDEDTSDRSHYDEEAMKRHKEQETKIDAVEKVDAAIAFLREMTTKAAKNCVRIFICLRNVILNGGDQEDCSEVLGYRKPNSLNGKVKRCRALLKEMPL